MSEENEYLQDPEEYFEAGLEQLREYNRTGGSERKSKELERFCFRVQLSYCHYCNQNYRAMPIQLTEEMIERLREAGHPLKKPGFMRRANRY